MHKWLLRIIPEGPPGLADRPSSPKRRPGKTSDALVAAIRELRCEREWGPHRIGYAPGLARSTVYAVLRPLIVVDRRRIVCGDDLDVVV